MVDLSQLTMDYIAFLWFLSVLTLLDLSQAKDNKQFPYAIELKTFNCAIIKPTFVKELGCIIQSKRLNPMLSARFENRNTTKNFNILLSVDVLKKDNTKMRITRNTLDGCKFLSSIYGSNIYGKIFKRVQRASNLPNKCPVQSDKLFEIRNYTVVASEFPKGLPGLSYQLRLKILIDNDEVAADIIIEAAIIY